MLNANLSQTVIALALILLVNLAFWFRDKLYTSKTTAP